MCVVVVNADVLGWTSWEVISKVAKGGLGKANVSFLSKQDADKDRCLNSFIAQSFAVWKWLRDCWRFGQKMGISGMKLQKWAYLKVKKRGKSPCWLENIRAHYGWPNHTVNISKYELAEGKVKIVQPLYENWDRDV